MTLDPHQCPDNIEGVAEAYIMGSLTAEQAAVFEDHYLGCDACATVLYETVDFVDAMKAAAKKVREEREESGQRLSAASLR